MSPGPTCSAACWTCWRARTAAGGFAWSPPSRRRRSSPPSSPTSACRSSRPTPRRRAGRTRLPGRLPGLGVDCDDADTTTASASPPTDRATPPLPLAARAHRPRTRSSRATEHGAGLARSRPTMRPPNAGPNRSTRLAPPAHAPPQAIAPRPRRPINPDSVESAAWMGYPPQARIVVLMGQLQRFVAARTPWYCRPYRLHPLKRLFTPRTSSLISTWSLLLSSNDGHSEIDALPSAMLTPVMSSFTFTSPS